MEINVYNLAGDFLLGGIFWDAACLLRALKKHLSSDPVIAEAQAQGIRNLCDELPSVAVEYFYDLKIVLRKIS